MSETEQGAGAAAGRPIRVLLVDDGEVFRTTLTKVLQRRGMLVAAAGSGEEGIAYLVANDCDVVVLDLKMPGLDGIATLERMREVRSTTRVVLLTGHGSVEAGLQAIRGLAFDFLHKPVEIDWLVDVIKAAAQNRRELELPEGAP